MQTEIIKYKKINSTNHEAARLLGERKINHQTCIVADYQEKGKGQQNNLWNSENGKNLLFSWIVFPEFLSVTSQFLLSKAVASAIIQFLKGYNLSGMIKWPNDILVESQKIGGILIENSIYGDQISLSIIGIGLNINQTVFPEFTRSAISMKSLTGIEYDLEELLKSLMESLEYFFNELSTGNTSLIDKLYLDHLYRKDLTSSFTCKGKQFKGKIIGVDQFGQLMIDSKYGRIAYGMHEIQMGS